MVSTITFSYSPSAQRNYATRKVRLDGAAVTSALDNGHILYRLNLLLPIWARGRLQIVNRS